MESYKLLLKPEHIERGGVEGRVRTGITGAKQLKHGRYSTISKITLNVNGLNVPFKRQIVRMN